jgi:hypothetical protein
MRNVKKNGDRPFFLVLTSTCFYDTTGLTPFTWDTHIVNLVMEAAYVGGIVLIFGSVGDLKGSCRITKLQHLNDDRFEVDIGPLHVTDTHDPVPETIWRPHGYGRPQTGVILSFDLETITRGEVASSVHPEGVQVVNMYPKNHALSESFPIT